MECSTPTLALALALALALTQTLTPTPDPEPSRNFILLIVPKTPDICNIKVLAVRFVPDPRRQWPPMKYAV